MRTHVLLLLMTCISTPLLADCLNDQMICNNNCIMNINRTKDYNCVNRCGERAQACMQQQFNNSSGNQDYGYNNPRNHQNPVDDDEEDNSPPPPTRNYQRAYPSDNGYGSNRPQQGSSTPASPAYRPSTYDQGNRSSGASGNAGISQAAPQKCTDLSHVVTGNVKRLNGPGHCNGEVVAHLTNNSSQKVTCNYQFEGSGKKDRGQTDIGPGKTVGGELGGMYSCGFNGNVNLRWSCFAPEQWGSGCGKL